MLKSYCDIFKVTPNSNKSGSPCWLFKQRISSFTIQFTDGPMHWCGFLAELTLQHWFHQFHTCNSLTTSKFIDLISAFSSFIYRHLWSFMLKNLNSFWDIALKSLWQTDGWIVLLNIKCLLNVKQLTKAGFVK